MKFRPLARDVEIRLPAWIFALILLDFVQDLAARFEGTLAAIVTLVAGAAFMAVAFVATWDVYCRIRHWWTVEKVRRHRDREGTP